MNIKIQKSLSSQPLIAYSSLNKLNQLHINSFITNSLRETRGRFVGIIQAHLRYVYALCCSEYVINSLPPRSCCRDYTKKINSANNVVHPFSC